MSIDSSRDSDEADQFHIAYQLHLSIKSRRATSVKRNKMIKTFFGLINLNGLKEEYNLNEIAPKDTKMHRKLCEGP